MLPDNENTATPRLRKPTVVEVILKYGVPLLISVGLCYLLFSRINFQEMISIIRTECNFWWIFLMMAISVLSHVLRALRWNIQLQALGVKAPKFVLILSIFGTYAVNLVLPRLGELWRSGWIARRQKAPFDTVFGSMVGDRLADTVMVALMTLLTFLLAKSQIMLYFSENSQTMENLIATLSSPWLWIVIAAAVALTWWVFMRFDNIKIIAKTKQFLIGIWQGFAVLTKMKGKGLWLFYTFAMWFCYYLQLYVAFFAFPLTAEMAATYGPVAILLCFCLTSISMGVPSNGGIGPWQWALIFGISMYAASIPGLTPQYATSFANLVMGATTLLLIALGIFTFICIIFMKRRTIPADVIDSKI